MRASAYKHYLLGLLLVILVFNYLDRMALGIVLQDIKVDLGLTDTQLGLLSGIAFALFYSVMGVPIARWADRGNRVTIITLTTALWSVAVALCGLAGNFAQLLMIRVGVAVGEAGCIPPAFSLMADYFNRAERPRASAIYGLGGPLSALIGFFLAGWFNELYGWRMTFALLGAPGLLLAALAFWTLKEPRRLAEASPDDAQARSTSAKPPAFKEVAVKLWTNRTYRHLLVCLSVISFFGYGILQWQPAFFLRSYGLSSGQVGLWMALAIGGGGLVGSYLGGEVASRYAMHNERRQFRGMAVAIAVAGLISTCAYLSSNAHVAFALCGLVFTGVASANGPIFATIQTLIPERMRAVAFALTYLFSNLIGMGLGPLAAGALSDSLHSAWGEESLRYALLMLSPGYLWAAWHAWRASKSVTDDITSALTGRAQG